MDRKKELLARAYFVVAVFTLIALVIAYRVVKISVFEGDKWRSKGARNVQWKEVNADRGNIYSDDESLLATSIQFFEIRMDMTVASKELFSKNVDSLAYLLSTTIRTDKSRSQWKADMKQARAKKNQYFFIARELDVEKLALVKTFPLLRHNKYKGGIIEIRQSRRVKPYREFASRTIGNDRENAPKTGIEGYFDKFLKGPTDRWLMKKVSATENLWLPVYDPSDFNIRRGDDVKTTLNMHLQDVVHTELSNAVIKYEAAHGVAIVMETKTGAIKAISNLTNYDGTVREVRNIGVGSSTEPGSTFKLATVLAMFEDSIADLDTKVNLNAGKATFYDRNMKDSEPHQRYEVALKTAFALSSNVGIAKLAHANYNYSTEGRKKFVSRLEKFGLKDKVDIEIEGEGLPMIKDPVKQKDQWYGTTIPWMAHGYEISMTPLQMLNFYNAVANDGVLMRPYLVSEIIKENGERVNIKPQVLRAKIASSSSIAKAKELLREVVLTGTATNLKSEAVAMAGKTGTTRINYSNKEEFAKYNASFCGFFPYENPEYSIIVVLYEPKGAFYGSAVAAPVFKAIAEKTMAWRYEMVAPINSVASEVEIPVNNVPEATAGFKKDFETIFKYVGLPYKNKTENDWVVVDPFESKMLIEGKSINKKRIPDVRGMGGRDALFVLENLGLKVALHGRGKVVNQSINPGTAVARQQIDIYLD